MTIPRITHVGFYFYRHFTPDSELVAEVYNGPILDRMRLGYKREIEDYQNFVEKNMTRLFEVLVQDPQIVVLHPGIKKVEGEGVFTIPDIDWLQTFAAGAERAVKKQRYQRAFLVDSTPICLDKFDPHVALEDLSRKPTLKLRNVGGHVSGYR